jgi:mannitol/fructose-specific phosphotransferase system IIA component (Ntr-type)
MKSVLNQLIQLQELNYALAEQQAANPGAPLEKLQQAISEIIQQLPAEISERYQRLQQRYPLAVVPIINGNCSRCGLAVPHALINAVRAAEQINSCPHCGRFLYYQEGLPRQPKKPLGAERPAQAGIARFSAPELMVPSLAAKTRDEAVAELVKLMAEHKFIEDPASVVDLSLHREAIVSTALDHGLAFPHVRNVEGGGLTFALGLKDKGIDFGAADGHLSKIIFFIVIPTPASAFYLRLLAGLVRTFSEADARKALLECEKPDQMWKALTKLTREAIP